MSPVTRPVTAPNHSAASLRQFQPVPFRARLLLAAELRLIDLALTPHARKDDDFRTRRAGLQARRKPQGVRTKFDDHGLLVPLTATGLPGCGNPHRASNSIATNHSI